MMYCCPSVGDAVKVTVIRSPDELFENITTLLEVSRVSDEATKTLL